MSEINPKLMDAAHKVARAAHDADVGNEPIFSQIGLRIIAAAIGIERERCAKIGDALALGCWDATRIEALTDMAAEIRSGE